MNLHQMGRVPAQCWVKGKGPDCRNCQGKGVRRKGNPSRDEGTGQLVPTPAGGEQGSCNLLRPQALSGRFMELSWGHWGQWGEAAVVVLGSVESAQKSVREVWTGSATSCAGDRALTLRKRC